MKTIRTCIIIVLAMLLVSCRQQNISPSPTAAITPSPAATETLPVQPLGTKTFGRYAVALNDALFYASDNAIWRFQNGSAAKLCDLPSGQIAEDFYVASDSVLYITAQQENPDKDGYDRILYRILISGGNPALEEQARSLGPMCVNGDTIHILQDGEVICIHAIDGAQLSCANVGDMARLVTTDTSGESIYYAMYEEFENNMPIGEANLMRLDMVTKKSELICSLFKPDSDTVCSLTDNAVYLRQTSDDGETYLFTIADSQSGGSDDTYPVPKSIIDSQLGSETLFVMKSAPYMLIASEGGNAELLTCYQLKEDGAVELWKINLSKPLQSALYDEQDECIALLCEGDASATFHLFTLDALSGAQKQAFAGNFGATESMLRLLDVGGTILVFSVTGEDYPIPTLLYAARLDDITAPFITGNITAKEE